MHDAGLHHLIEKKEQPGNQGLKRKRPGRVSKGGIGGGFEEAFPLSYPSSERGGRDWDLLGGGRHLRREKKGNEPTIVRTRR